MEELEAQYKSLINDQQMDSNQSDDSGDGLSPLVMDLAEALKPDTRSRADSETDTCSIASSETESVDSNEKNASREMVYENSDPFELNGTKSVTVSNTMKEVPDDLKTSSVSAPQRINNMKQLKNFVNFYKVTKSFEQKLRSLKSKNKNKAHFSMSSLSDAREVISESQNNGIHKMRNLRKWRSEEHVNNEDGNVELDLNVIRTRLLGDKSNIEFDTLRCLEEPVLSPIIEVYAKEDHYNFDYNDTPELERDPLSNEEQQDIKPCIANLLEETQLTGSSPKKGRIKLRNITELVDMPTLGEARKRLNIPVKVDLKNLKVIGQTKTFPTARAPTPTEMPKLGQTKVSSISKPYLCYSDIESGLEKLAEDDEFNPKIEATFSLAGNETQKICLIDPSGMKTNSDSSKQPRPNLNIPSKEILMSELGSAAEKSYAFIVGSDNKIAGTITNVQKSSVPTLVNKTKEIITQNFGKPTIVMSQTSPNRLQLKYTANTIAQRKSPLKAVSPEIRQKKILPKPLGSILEKVPQGPASTPETMVEKSLLNPVKSTNETKNEKIPPKLTPIVEKILPQRNSTSGNCNEKTSPPKIASKTIDRFVIDGKPIVFNVLNKDLGTVTSETNTLGQRKILQIKQNGKIKMFTTSKTLESQRNSNNIKVTVHQDPKGPVKLAPNLVSSLQNPRFMSVFNPSNNESPAHTLYTPASSQSNVRQHTSPNNKQNSLVQKRPQTVLNTNKKVLASPNSILSKSDTIIGNIKLVKPGSSAILAKPMNANKSELPLKLPTTSLSVTPVPMAGLLKKPLESTNPAQNAKPAESTRSAENITTKKAEVFSSQDFCSGESPGGLKFISCQTNAVPSASTLAKTKLLFRNDLVKKDDFTRMLFKGTIPRHKMIRPNIQNRYFCKWCRTGFCKRYLFQQHIYRITCNMVYECRHCSDRRILFSNRCQLLQHLLLHFGSHKQIVINYSKLKMFKISTHDIMYAHHDTGASIGFYSDNEEESGDEGEDNDSTRESSKKQTPATVTQMKRPKTQKKVSRPDGIVTNNIQTNSGRNQSTRPNFSPGMNACPFIMPISKQRMSSPTLIHSIAATSNPVRMIRNNKISIEIPKSNAGEKPNQNQTRETKSYSVVVSQSPDAAPKTFQNYLKSRQSPLPLTKLTIPSKAISSTPVKSLLNIKNPNNQLLSLKPAVEAEIINLLGGRGYKNISLQSVTEIHTMPDRRTFKARKLPVVRREDRNATGLKLHHLQQKTLSDKNENQDSVSDKDNEESNQQNTVSNKDEESIQQNTVSNKDEEESNQQNTVADKGDKENNQQNTVADKGDKESNQQNTVADKGNEESYQQNTVADKGDEESNQQNTVADKGDEESNQQNIVSDKGDEESNQQNTVADKGDKESNQQNTVADKGDEESIQQNTVSDKGDEESNQQNTVADKGDEESNQQNIVSDKGDEESNQQNTVADKGDEESNQQNTVADKGDEESNQQNTVADKGEEESNQQNTVADKGDEESNQQNTVSHKGDEESNQQNTVSDKRDEESNQQNTVADKGDEESNQQNTVADNDEESNQQNTVADKGKPLENESSSTPIRKTGDKRTLEECGIDDSDSTAKKLKQISCGSTSSRNENEMKNIVNIDNGSNVDSMSCIVYDDTLANTSEIVANLKSSIKQISNIQDKIVRGGFVNIAMENIASDVSDSNENNTCKIGDEQVKENASENKDIIIEDITANEGNMIPSLENSDNVTDSTDTTNNITSKK
ncbi:hypothetical protein WDU94_006749 [Cyamophila willieti]